MIGHLKGQFGGATGDGSVIIEVGGVGYCVRVSQGTLLDMQQAGVTVSLYIHTAVREDAIDLYGFTTADELAFFKQLMSISGIGPKTALGILNASDVPTLKRSIAQGDATALTKVFGIGKKSAERIVVELRDKVTIEISIDPAGPRSADGEVIEALMTLGYSAQESRAALKSIPAKVEDMRERLALALKYLGSHALP